MTLHILSTKEETAHAIAKHIVALAQQRIAEKGRFTFALSGGESPGQLYRLLAAPPFSEAIDWRKVYFFFGDERYVPLTDAGSNFHTAATTLLKPLQIPEAHILFIDTSTPVGQAAATYQQKLEAFFEGREIVMDLVLLGMGTNLHTASLFPHDAVLRETSPAVRAVKTDDKHMYRITLNAPLINQAEEIYFLVWGEAKAAAVRQALQGPKDTEAFPVQLIRTQNTTWFLDEAAAAELKR